MLTWLRGNSGATTNASDENVISASGGNTYANIEDTMIGAAATPGPAAFAFQALRYGLLGTPRQPEPTSNKMNEKPTATNTSTQEEHDREDSDILNITTGPAKPTERVLTFDAGTPVKRSNPHGILLTPGTALARKKTVSFGPSVDAGDQTMRTGRIRSGLPSSYPGKFPSPWTPKVSSPAKRRSLIASPSIAKTSIDIYEDEGEDMQPASENNQQNLEKLATVLQQKVNAQINAVKANTAMLSDFVNTESTVKANDEMDVTINIDEPKSRSGKHWKKKYDHTVSQAEKQIEFYKNRKDLSVEFASKKDAQCSDLAVRLSEEMQIRHNLQVEADKWHKLAVEGSTPLESSTIGSDRTKDRLAQEVLELREKLRQRDRELKDITRTSQRRQEDNERMIHEQQELRLALEETEKALASTKLRLEHSPETSFQVKRATYEGKDVQTLRCQIQSLQSDLDKTKKEANKRQTEKEKLENDLASLQGKIRTQTREIDDLRHGTTNGKSLNDEFRQDMERLVMEAEAKAKRNRQTIEQLNEELRIEKEDRQRAEEYNREILTEREKLHKQNQALTAKLAQSSAEAVNHDTTLFRPTTASPKTSSPRRATLPNTKTPSAKTSMKLTSPNTAHPTFDIDDDLSLPTFSGDDNVSDDSACDTSSKRVKAATKLELEYSRIAKDPATEYTPKPPTLIVDENMPIITHIAPVKSALRTTSTPSAAPRSYAFSPRPKMVLLDITSKQSTNSKETKMKQTMASDKADMASDGEAVNVIFPGVANTQQQQQQKSRLSDPERKAAAAARVAERRKMMKAQMK